jgi:hypothetical protein
VAGPEPNLLELPRKIGADKRVMNNLLEESVPVFRRYKLPLGISAE